VSLRTRLGIDIDADASGVDRGVSQAQGRLGGLKGGLLGLAKGAAVGLGAVGAAAGYIGKEVSESASRTQQAMGGVETVFGNASKRVQKWAEDAAMSVGLAESEYAELSTIVGAQLQNMGASQDEAAKKTKDLIKTGADMAATYGGSVSEAVAAVSSLLKGEADPIERYGVGIKAADVNARLAAEGLDGLTGKALTQAKAQATLSLLNEQTARTQGAFARESDTLAGAQERLGAKVENLKSKMGEKLLPVLTSVTTWAVEKLLPGAERLGSTLGEKLGPVIGKVSGFIQEKLIPAGRSMFEWYAEKIAPRIADLGRIVLPALADAFAKITRKIEENRPELEKLRDAFKRVAEFIVDKVYPVLATTLGEAIDIASTVIGGIIDVVGNLVTGFDKVVTAIKNVIEWLGKIDVPDINLPFTGDGRYSLRGGPRGPSLPGFGGGSAPAAPAVTYDHRTYLTVSVDGSGIVDENAVASAIVTAINNLYTRLGLPAPLPAGV